MESEHIDDNKITRGVSINLAACRHRPRGRHQRAFDCRLGYGLSKLL
jgi:hypothetical protein